MFLVVQLCFAQAVGGDADYQTVLDDARRAALIGLVQTVYPFPNQFNETSELSPRQYATARSTSFALIQAVPLPASEICRR